MSTRHRSNMLRGGELDAMVNNIEGHRATHEWDRSRDGHTK